MPKKSKAKSIPLVISRPVAVDRGPDVRHDQTHPDPIVRAQWDDPDDTNPNSRQPWQVHGGRRRDGLRDMRSRGAITEAMWVGAEMFRDDYAIAEGAQDRSGEMVGGPSGFRGIEPGERQMDAMRRVREAWAALGARDAPTMAVIVVGLVVLEGGTIEALAQALRCRHGTAADRLRGTLTLLADFYAGPQGARTR